MWKERGDGEAEEKGISEIGLRGRGREERKKAMAEEIKVGKKGKYH